MKENNICLSGATPQWLESLVLSQRLLILDTATILKQPSKEYAKYKGRNKLQRLPQVICIGAKKCGTGALQSFLSHHPKVFTPSMYETHFFNYDLSFVKGVDYYNRSLMPFTTKEEITFEKTPKYFIQPLVPQRIKDTYGDVDIKLVLILCDPVLRTYSDYNHVLIGKESELKTYVQSFHDFPNFVSSHLIKHSKPIDSNNMTAVSTLPDIFRVGLYALHLQRWLKYFRLENIFILDGEVLSRDPGTVMVQLQRFLGLETEITKRNFVYNKTKGFYCFSKLPKDANMKCLSKAKGNTRSVQNGTVFSAIPDSTMRILRDFYRIPNKKLEKLIGHKFQAPWMFM
ncbi:heparan sulfate glucosamine 3-O-sulfotransferase 1-like [Ciona intestinalis]